MKIAVISSQLVLKINKESYATNVTFFQLLFKASAAFDEIFVICREDRRNKKRKRFVINNKRINMLTYQAGFNNRYFSLILESPLIFIKILTTTFKIRKQIDVIWIPDIRVVGFISVLIAKILKIPFFLYIRGDNYKEAVNRTTTKSNFIKFIYTLSIKFEYLITKLITQKTFTFVCGTRLLEIYRTHENNIFKFISSLINKDDIKHVSRNIKTKKKLKILFVGRLVEYKGLKYVLQALKILIHSDSSNKKNIELIVAGDGEDRQTYEKFVMINRLSNYVSFKGYINDAKKLNDLYTECDLLVVPSLTEGTPKVIPEAMANGLPIIATKVGDMPFMIDHKKNGYIVEPANSEEMAIAITNLINNPDQYSEISKAALIKAEEFTFHNQFSKIMDVINQLVDENRNNK